MAVKMDPIDSPACFDDSKTINSDVTLSQDTDSATVDPAKVPKKGEFFMHDDRHGHNSGKSRNKFDRSLFDA